MKNLWIFRNYYFAFRQKFLLLSVLIIGSVFLEGMGIGLFYPLLYGIQNGGNFLADGKFNVVVEGLNLLGLSANVGTFIFFIFLIIVGRFFLVNLTQIVSARTYNPIMKNIRDDGFKKLLTLPMGYFNFTSSGKIVEALVFEVEKVGQSLNFVVLIIVNFCFMLVYTVGVLFISFKLSLIVLVVAALRYVILGFYIKKSRYLGDQSTKIRANLNSYFIGIYQGIDLIKSYATEEKENIRFKEMTFKVLDNSNRIVSNQAGSGFSGGVLEGGLVCSMVYLAVEKLNVEGSLVLVFLLILSRMAPAVTAINDSRIRIAEYTSGIIYLKSMFDENVPRQRFGNLIKSEFNNSIVLKEVAFSYDSAEKFVIKGVCLRINKNEKIAIVGESGAGKTTLIRLLLRLYDPQAGSIFIDDTNILDISRESWKNLISVVAQDTFIFDDTVENNIKYSAERCDSDEFWTAVKQARAEEFINKLPNKEKTKVGEKGVKLSGGQRQRIAIARAFLRNSPILILDEATSALDSFTESLIQEALAVLAENRTMIIIAHRLSTIKNADRIVVLDKGQIAEIGTHAELLKNDYLYRKYHNLQVY